MNNAHLITAELNDRWAVVWNSLAASAPYVVDFGDRERVGRFVDAVAAGTPPLTGIPGLDDILGLSDAEIRSGLAGRTVTDSPAGIGLSVAENCNFACSYCFAHTAMQESLARGQTRMSWPTARSALTWFLTTYRGSGRPHVGFTGGEPLMNWPVVRESLRYVHDGLGMTNVDMSINTNAALVTPEIAATLARHAVVVGSSLDGPPAGSDLVRYHRDGRGASPAILAGWRTLLGAGCRLGGFNATFSARNLTALDPALLDFAEAWGFRAVRVDFDVIHAGIDDPAEAVERLWRVYQDGARRGIGVSGLWANPANNLMGHGDGTVARFCGAVTGRGLGVHPSGRLSLCGYSATDFGTVTADGVSFDHAALRDFVAAYLPGRRAACLGCDIEGSCAGGCNSAQEWAAATGDRRSLEFNCTLYREMTRRLLVHEAARLTAAGRAAASPGFGTAAHGPARRRDGRGR